MLICLISIANGTRKNASQIIPIDSKVVKGTQDWYIWNGPYKVVVWNHEIF